MADKWYTAASGNWSTAANWNGGTLPTAADDVYADGKAVVIDQNVTVLSIRNTQRTGGTVGGTFTVNTGGYTINCTATVGIIPVNTGTGCLQIANNSGTTTLNLNLNSSVNAAGSITISGTGTINFNGNISGGIGTNGWAIQITGLNPTLTIVGDLTTKSSNTSHAILIQNSCTINITGNVNNASTVTNTPTISQIGAQICTISVTGNVIANLSSPISLASSSTINITGNLTANNANAVLLTASPTVTVVGTITASNTTQALFQTGGTVTFSGTAINSSNSVMAIYCPTIRLYNANTVEWRFRDELGNVKTLYSAGIALGNPAITNVRSGITYGASLELTGTMIVPTPSNVRISVPTDNTVGTGQLTAADFLAAIAASSDPIAVRLNNVSTVDTSGAQMASYNV